MGHCGLILEEGRLFFLSFKASIETCYDSLDACGCELEAHLYNHDWPNEKELEGGGSVLLVHCPEPGRLPMFKGGG